MKKVSLERRLLKAEEGIRGPSRCESVSTQKRRAITRTIMDEYKFYRNSLAYRRYVKQVNERSIKVN